jgi:hypothetical protein
MVPHRHASDKSAGHRESVKFALDWAIAHKILAEIPVRLQRLRMTRDAGIDAIKSVVLSTRQARRGHLASTAFMRR